MLAGLALWELAGRAMAGTFLRATGVTLAEAAAGFVIGNAVAVPLAALAIAAPQVTLAALAVSCTTLVPLLVGLRAVPAVWLDLVASYVRGRWTEIARASLSYLIAGLQIAAPAAFLGAVVGELTGAERGLGVLTIGTMRGLQVKTTWTIATLATGVSLAAYAAVGWLGDRLSPDRPALILAAPPAPRVHGGARTVAAVIVALILVLWWGAMEAAGLSPSFAKRPGDVWTYLATDPWAAWALMVAMGQTAA